jgi:hypothetical protein
MGAWHQDWLTGRPSVAMWLWLWHRVWLWDKRTLLYSRYPGRFLLCWIIRSISITQCVACQHAVCITVDNLISGFPFHWKSYLYVGPASVYMRLLKLVLLFRSVRTRQRPAYSFIHSFICSFIHQWLYSLLLGPGLFSFVIFFIQTSDQPIARPLPTQDTAQT